MTQPDHNTSSETSFSEHAEDGEDVGALLGLEPVEPEKAGESSCWIDESKQSLASEERLSPLLGTIRSQLIENNEKSSPRRSQNRPCYDSLLRNVHGENAGR